VVLAVAVPPGPVTVVVKVVVCAGEMLTDPLGAAMPIPGSILAVVALVEFQLSVVDSPAWMLVGLAVRVTVGSWILATVTVTLSIDAPPGPVAVIV
jgi:hypothetical protein